MGLLTNLVPVALVTVALLNEPKQETAPSFPIRGLICSSAEIVTTILQRSAGTENGIVFAALEVMQGSDSGCRVEPTHRLHGNDPVLVKELIVSGKKFYIYEIQIVGEIVIYDGQKKLRRYETPRTVFTFSAKSIEKMRERKK